MGENKIKLGDAIFRDIDKNEYLSRLYRRLLYCYGIQLFELNKAQQDIELFSTKEKQDLLRFADLLSKSNHPTKADAHKIWAQEIAVLMNELYKNDAMVRLYAGDIFSSVGNHKGIENVDKSYRESNVLDQIFAEYRSDYLTIPASPGDKFFIDQKAAYDHLKDDFFSYSAPTSMGKSFIMRMFIKDEIMHGVSKNYALVVPTKALINEVRAKVIDDLGGERNSEKINYLARNDYCVVTAASDIALEEQHNFILVMTPERLLYLLVARKDLRIDYLFIDEAHKLSGKNSRAPFYYKVVDMLLQQKPQPHFIFASPNIPNPRVYLRMMTQAEAGDENALAISYSPVVQIKFLMDLQHGKIDVYNEHAAAGYERIPLAKSGSTLGLNDFLMVLESYNRSLSKEKRRQSIVYYNGRNKAVDAANAFSKAIEGWGDINDPDLVALSKDIEQEVHSEYYLARMVRQGIAYHIGYLPASIRARIEELFQAGSITVMFCTSTLLEGVNLPADNLFIMDNKIALSEMNPVDFRNLIGRVGRISFNLYGNVLFVSEKDSKVKTDDYVRMLQEPVPEQALSIATDPSVLKRAEKKYVAEILKSGKSEIPKRVNAEGKALQSEESYIMMRKFGLILLRDIVNDRDSLVRREFREFLTPEDEEHIRETYKNAKVKPDDDINTSVDQTRNLIAAIKRKNNPLRYPDLVNGGFRYEDVLGFLDELSVVFNWETYESGTLGKPSLRRWYAVILSQWMEGGGLQFIMNRALQYHKDHPDPFWENHYGRPTVYNYRSLEHHNIVFADTLEVIENIILFSISNYFLRFSNEFRKIKGDAELNKNNWYEYVEFGTTNPLTILLQRNGFSRESARYIKDHPEYVLRDGATGQLMLSASLDHCGSTDVCKEVVYIRQNVPGIFVE
ncbi:MAG: DEAD/DEAH box helicase [Bilifractor sp.]